MRCLPWFMRTPKGFAQYQEMILSAGATGFWPRVYDGIDVGPNGYHGTVAGGVTAAAGPMINGEVSRCGEFDGTGGAITTSGYVGDFGLNSMTIAMWIYVNDVDAYNAVCGTWSDLPYWYIYVRPGGQCWMIINIGDGNRLIHAGVVTPGVWVTIAYVLDRATRLYGYIDGVRADCSDDSLPGTYIDGVSFNAGHEMEIGTIGRSYSTWALRGRIGNMFNTYCALSAEQIKYHYEAAVKGV